LYSIIILREILFFLLFDFFQIFTSLNNSPLDNTHENEHSDIYEVTKKE
jgi:hypothetical protein